MAFNHHLTRTVCPAGCSCEAMPYRDKMNKLFSIKLVVGTIFLMDHWPLPKASFFR